MENSDYQAGYETAFGVVDYISAIPAHFDTPASADFWRGYISGEMNRAIHGKRSLPELRRAVAAYCDALRNSSF